MSSRFKVELISSRRSRKRSDIDIVASILCEASKGARKTRIMYRCNLSHRQLQVYLKLLLGIGLLTRQSEVEGDEPYLFRTTAKGLRFLDAYSTLKALMT